MLRQSRQNISLGLVGTKFADFARIHFRVVRPLFPIKGAIHIIAVHSDLEHGDDVGYSGFLWECQRDRHTRLRFAILPSVLGGEFGCESTLSAAFNERTIDLDDVGVVVWVLRRLFCLGGRHLGVVVRYISLHFGVAPAYVTVRYSAINRASGMQFPSRTVQCALVWVATSNTTHVLD